MQELVVSDCQSQGTSGKGLTCSEQGLASQARRPKGQPPGILCFLEQS